MISTLVDLLGNFYASNDFTHFETIARTIQASVPNDLVSLQFLGLAYYQTGRINEAVSVFDRVVRRKKPLAGAVDAPVVAELSEDDNCAEICYREATRHGSQLAKAWYDLGTVLLKLKKFDLAIPAFRNYLAARPARVRAKLALRRRRALANGLAPAFGAAPR